MTLKRKLTLGLGFLFLLILVLIILFSLNIGRLSQDAENILKDNYKSLVFSKNMLSALEDMRTAIVSVVFNPGETEKASAYYGKLFEAGRAKFDDSLRAENGNITELNEREYAAEVNQGFPLFTDLGRRLAKGEGGRALYFDEWQPALETLQNAVNKINDVNMQAVERKSRTAQQDSAHIIQVMAGLGVLCALLAFVYFWYFPFYVSNTIAYLAERMKGLLEKSGIALDLKTSDEAFIILQGINLLENKADNKGGKDIQS
jgi:hypothetical protein